MNHLFDVKGKTALITGSGQGIGFTLAKGLGSAGCTVILNDIIEERLNAAVDELKREGINAHGVVFDVRDEKSVGEKVLKAEKEIGPIDILVNNAGIQVRGPLEDFALTDWQRLIDINLTGVFIVAKSVVKGMIERKAGKIINICSMQSELARPSIAPYTASKASDYVNGHLVYVDGGMLACV